MAEYQGKKVSLNKPFRTPKEKKKFAVYVKNDKGNVIARKATVLAVVESRENRIELQRTTGVGRCGVARATT